MNRTRATDPPSAREGEARKKVYKRRKKRATNTRRIVELFGNGKKAGGAREGGGETCIEKATARRERRGLGEAARWGKGLARGSEASVEPMVFSRGVSAAPKPPTTSLIRLIPRSDSNANGRYCPPRGQNIQTKHTHKYLEKTNKKRDEFLRACARPNEETVYK